jgi:hypothetical protein
MLRHMFFYFLCCMKLWFFFFFIFEKLGKTKKKISDIYIFAIILRKPSILKPKLYFYKKIQTTKWIRYKTINLSHFVFWPESSSVHITGLDPTSLTRSLGQANELAGPQQACMKCTRTLVQEEVNYKCKVGGMHETYLNWDRQRRWRWNFYTESLVTETDEDVRLLVVNAPFFNSACLFLVSL